MKEEVSYAPVRVCEALYGGSEKRMKRLLNFQYFPMG
jgi:hypothetical protein